MESNAHVTDGTEVNVGFVELDVFFPLEIGVVRGCVLVQEEQIIGQMLWCLEIVYVYET